MKVETLIPPLEQPVTYEACKAHLRLDDDTEQAWVESAIAAATEYAEVALQRSLVTRTLKATWYDTEAQPWPLTLPRGPVTAVTSILDNNGNAVSTTGLQIRRTGTADYVWLPAGTGSVQSVTYTAGYGTAGDVPYGIRQAILMHVAHLWRYREAVTGDQQRYVELGLQAIYGQHQSGGLL